MSQDENEHIRTQGGDDVFAVKFNYLVLAPLGHGICVGTHIRKRKKLVSGLFCNSITNHTPVYTKIGQNTDNVTSFLSNYGARSTCYSVHA